MRGIVYAASTIIQIGKIFIVISFAMFCPRLFLYYSQYYGNYCHGVLPGLKLGIENIGSATRNHFAVDGVSCPRVALITSLSTTTQQGEHSIDVLVKNNICIKKVGVPFADVHLFEKKFSHKAIPVSALYSQEKNCNKDFLLDIDEIVIDLADVGMSYEDYIRVLKDILQYAAQEHIAVVVLDRPSLISNRMEGIMMDVNEKKDLLPIRSGMTLAELSTYINMVLLEKGADVRVIPMSSFKRSHQEQKMILSNIAHETLNTTTTSNGFLDFLSKIEPFNIGIGSRYAFECLLLPETVSIQQKSWCELQLLLHKKGVKSRFYRFFNHSDKIYYSGLRFSAQSLRELSTVESLVQVLSFFKECGVDFHFSDYFDVAIGTPLVREVVLGLKDLDELSQKINEDLKQFFERARAMFLYAPLPEVTFI